MIAEGPSTCDQVPWPVLPPRVGSLPIRSVVATSQSSIWSVPAFAATVSKEVTIFISAKGVEQSPPVVTVLLICTRYTPELVRPDISKGDPPAFDQSVGNVIPVVTGPLNILY